MKDTPETQEAVERWNQGKINIFDEMARLERERDEAREQLRIAVGLLSTQPQFADKHPEEVLAFVKEVGK